MVDGPSPDLLRRPPSPAEGERGNSCHVLTLFLTGAVTLAITSPILVLGGARSRGVADAGRGAVPPQASHACGRGRSILAWLQVHLKRTARDEQSGSHTHTIPHRAGLQHTPPSITGKARSSQLRAPRCWIFDICPLASSRTA